MEIQGDTALMICRHSIAFTAAHLEGSALDDSQNQALEFAIVPDGFGDDLVDGTFVVVLESAAEGVDEQLAG